jgi:hypothetical protein
MENFRSGRFSAVLYDSKVYYRFEYDDDVEFPYTWRVLTHDGLVIVDDEVEQLEKEYWKINWRGND